MRGGFSLKHEGLRLGGGRGSLTVYALPKAQVGTPRNRTRPKAVPTFVEMPACQLYDFGKIAYLELNPQRHDQLLRCRLTRVILYKTILKRADALVQEGAEVIHLTVDLLLQRVELRVRIAICLCLLHCGPVDAAHVLLRGGDNLSERTLQVCGTDVVAPRVYDVALQGSRNSIHVHSNHINDATQLRRELPLGVQSS